MGLDQYIKARREPLPSPVTWPEEGPDGDTWLAQFRKHANLQGWMEALYRAKGGTEEFNCQPVELTAKDLDDLERDVENLPHTTGFFFGQSQECDIAATRAAIAKARLALRDGWTVYYDSWW